MIEEQGRLAFEFWATRRGRADRVQSRILIGLPEPHGSAGDNICRIRIDGFHTLSTHVFGASPFQALDLAISLVKLEMSTRTDEWEFFFSEDGPVSFAS